MLWNPMKCVFHCFPVDFTSHWAEFSTLAQCTLRRACAGDLSRAHTIWAGHRKILNCLHCWPKNDLPQSWEGAQWHVSGISKIEHRQIKNQKSSNLARSFSKVSVYFIWWDFDGILSLDPIKSQKKIPRQPGSCVFSRGDRKTYAIGRSPGPRAVCGTGGAGTAVATRGTELGETLMADSVAMLCLLCGWCLVIWLKGVG